MKCPNCGKEIANESKFCEYCGKPIEKKRNTQSLWMVFIVLLVVGLVGVMAYNMNQPSAPDEPVTPTNTMQRYTGKIGSYPITMFINLSITSGKMGHYYYNKYKTEIALYVEDYQRNEDGSVECSLVEETSGHGSTGKFHITVYPSHSIQGSFVNSKGEEYSVNLN